jgi:hypothetical protein
MDSCTNLIYMLGDMRELTRSLLVCGAALGLFTLVLAAYCLTSVARLARLVREVRHNG